MGDDHKRCDRIYADLENVAAKKVNDEAIRKFGEFRNEMEKHFHAEENILFPALEGKTGMVQGPTSVMRMEHQQMRNLFQSMENRLKNGDRNGFLGDSETLHYLMQQHNAKEENMLYPMTDQQLGEISSDLVEKMKEWIEGAHD